MRSTIWNHAKVNNANLSVADFRDADLSGADLSGAILVNAKLQGARLPWRLMEGVNLAGAEGWVPTDKDMSNAKLKGADLSECDLSGVNLSGSDLSDTLLSKANLKSTNLINSKMQGARLPAWIRGLMEGVKLAGSEGWVPANKDLSNAKLKGADLSKCDLSGACLRGADLRETKLEGTNLRGADLSAAIFHAARGARPDTTLFVPGVDRSGHSICDGPVKMPQVLQVFALTIPRTLTLRRVTMSNVYDDGEQHHQFCNDNSVKDCVKDMEVQTGPSERGPWTSVVKFTSRQTTQQQTFVVAPDAPLLAGFVKVLVHDTYDGQAFVKSMVLEGEAWG